MYCIFSTGRRYTIPDIFDDDDMFFEDSDSNPRPRPCSYSGDESKAASGSKRPMFSEDSDSEPLVNQGIYSSVKSKVASGSKGTKVQSSSASGQVHLQTEKQNH